MLFINKGVQSKQEFDTAQDALSEAIKDGLPKGTRTYANGGYVDVEKAAEMKLEPYQYLREGKDEPSWQISFWTEKAVEKKNRDENSGKRAPKQRRAPALPNAKRPLY